MGDGPAVQGHDVIVIGASAGGVEAAAALVRALPAGLAASVFVVIHFPAESVSVLPRILARGGALPASHPADGDPVERGRVYTAPPDRHLLLEDGRVRVARGPRENGHRPAVDPLFRSAARWYGPRVVAVVLSGNLDDGTAGLLAVKRRGGTAVVQDPDTALFPGMPTSAITHVAVDHVVPVEEMAALLVTLVNTPVPPEAPPMDERTARETEIARMDPASMEGDERPGTPSGFTCPECHGTLFEIDEGELLRFRCRVGHAYGAETLMADHTTHVEAALWTALKALRERVALAHRMQVRMEASGNRISALRFAEQAADAARSARVLETVLLNGDGGQDAAEPQIGRAAAGD